MSKKVKIKDLAPAVQKLVKRDIANVKRFPEGSKVALKNQHIINLTDTSSIWVAGGELEARGFIGFSISADLILTNFSQFDGLRFYASGSGGGIEGIVESEVAGAFYIDPASLVGNIDYTFACGSFLEDGGVALTLYSSSNSKWGFFAGQAAGVCAAYVSGVGTLSIL